jgi:long-subunit acyl-CoA synthetase (AMP-forming)
MVYHSANPRALNGCVKHLLPTHFFQVPRGWATVVDYLTSELEDRLQEYCARENLAFKSVLIVESANALIVLQQSGFL